MYYPYMGSVRTRIDTDCRDEMAVQRWTGRESRALREAKRVSVRQFARELGVSDRAVSKWEAGGQNYTQRPDSQAILDTALRKVDDETRERFEMFLNDFQEVPEPSPPQAAQFSGNPIEINDDLPANADGLPRSITHPIDGKLMALVDGGLFPSGADNSPTMLASFYIDVYPTTNEDYANFLRETGRKPPSHWTEANFPPELASHPVVNVTYRDAEAYAAWTHKELPSSLEWEKSARGPRGNIYPWGNQETPAKCNVRQTGVRATTPVDRYHSGVSHYDVYDLAGNVWEWCRTETDPGRYVLKGSAFTSPLAMASGASMNDASETMLDDDTGFRCVSQAEAIKDLLNLP